MAQVSVIIPTYNRKSVLERALDSVVRQTYTEWELMVLDDGSDDGTEEFFEQWRRKQSPALDLRYLRTHNCGVSQARNRAARETSAPWLAFLDSDDEWLPGKLERQMALSAGYSLIHGEEIWIRGGVRVNPMKKHRKGGGRLFARAVELCCISPSTVLLKRTLFEDLGGFRADFPVCEDYELWLRITARHEVGFVSEPVIVKYGGHEDQLSRNYPAMDYLRVRALRPFLAGVDLGLSSEERQLVAATIVVKCDILLRGYDKHKRFDHSAQVEAWRAEALCGMPPV